MVFILFQSKASTTADTLKSKSSFHYTCSRDFIIPLLFMLVTWQQLCILLRNCDAAIRYPVLDNNIAQSCACTQRHDSPNITKPLLQSSQHLPATYEKCRILKQFCLCVMYVLFFLSPSSSLVTTFAWKIASSFSKKFIHSCCCYFFSLHLNS